MKEVVRAAQRSTTAARHLATLMPNACHCLDHANAHAMQVGLAMERPVHQWIHAKVKALTVTRMLVFASIPDPASIHALALLDLRVMAKLVRLSTNAWMVATIAVNTASVFSPALVNSNVNALLDTLKGQMVSAALTANLGLTMTGQNGVAALPSAGRTVFKRVLVPFHGRIQTARAQLRREILLKPDPVIAFAASKMASSVSLTGPNGALAVNHVVVAYRLVPDLYFGRMHRAKAKSLLVKILK